MKIERDKTKTEKLSLKLRAYKDAARKDNECYETEAAASETAAKLYSLAETIFEDAEKLESVGMDHLDAVLIAMMNYKRMQSNVISGTTVYNSLANSLLR